MKPIFILIRGNSGSGKAKLAHELQNYFGYQRSLLLHEDILRLDFFNGLKAPIDSLIESMTLLGKQSYPVTILEGVLPRSIYGDTLIKLIQEFGAGAFMYYLDVPFAQAVKNNAQKRHPLSYEVLQDGWLEDDALGGNERQLANEETIDLTEQILADIKGRAFIC